MTPHACAGDLVVTGWSARFRGRTLPCATGRGGVTRRKREGDGATPAGVMNLIGLLFRPDRIAARQLPGWARPIGPFDKWSDDPVDPDYNQYLPSAPDHRYGAERLHRPDPLYDLILLTDWNWPIARKGHGSAIFVHTWRKHRHPTEGCMAFARADLLWIVRRLEVGNRLIVRPSP